MTMSETLEGLMLGCFSLGWYWSIFAMIWTRQPYGKAGAFVGFTVTGYTLGLTARIIDWQMGGAFSYLIVLYSWNLAICSADLLLLWHYARRQRRAEALGFCPLGAVARP